jgi:hypothetical protein
MAGIFQRWGKFSTVGTLILPSIQVLRIMADNLAYAKVVVKAGMRMNISYMDLSACKPWRRI